MKKSFSNPFPAVFMLAAAYPLCGRSANRFAVSSDGALIHYHHAGRSTPALVFIRGWACDLSYRDEQVLHFL